MKTLLLTHPLPAKGFADALHAIDPLLPLLEYHVGLTDAELVDVVAALGWRFPDGVAARLPQLRWVCSIGAGVDKLLVPELPAQVQVSRIVDAEQADGIAQFVVLMALRHARSLPVYEAQQRLRQWTRQPIGARFGVLLRELLFERRQHDPGWREVQSLAGRHDHSKKPRPQAHVEREEKGEQHRQRKQHGIHVELRETAEPMESAGKKNQPSEVARTNHAHRPAPPRGGGSGRPKPSGAEQGCQRAPDQPALFKTGVADGEQDAAQGGREPRPPALPKRPW